MQGHRALDGHPKLNEAHVLHAHALRGVLRWVRGGDGRRRRRAAGSRGSGSGARALLRLLW